MQSKNLKIYPAKGKTKLGLWFRRAVLGHYIVEGKELKSMLPKHKVDKRIIKNKELYGVIVRRNKNV